MKKIKDVETIIYKNESISIVKINDSLHLYNDVISFNEIFDILIYGIQNQITDQDFWKIKISEQDILNSKPVNLIYFLSGGDSVWKDNNIYKKEWLEMIDVFIEHFTDRINKVLKITTLKDLYTRLKNKLAIEDFYELGLKLDLIHKNEITL